jgi:hypothetical protein
VVAGVVEAALRRPLVFPVLLAGWADSPVAVVVVVA